MDNKGVTRPAGWRMLAAHPKPLSGLFMTESAERFGYYGMRALLALYLAEHFVFRDNAVAGLYGAFTSLVYLTPLFGGIIADRILGARRSIKIGIILMAAGYFGLCFGGVPAQPYLEVAGNRFSVQVVENVQGRTNYITTPAGPRKLEVDDDGRLRIHPAAGADRKVAVHEKGTYRFDGERNRSMLALLLFSLSLVIVGTGLFKPNVAALVGRLYSADDPRRDSGFSIFYMGINLGSLAAQFLCPLAVMFFGWPAGFALASAALLGAFVTFSRSATPDAEPHAPSPIATLFVYLGIAAAVPLSWFLLNNTLSNAEIMAGAAASGGGIAGYIGSLPLLGKMLFLVFSLAVVGLPLWAWRVGSREEFQRMKAAIVLTIFAVAFFTLLEQAGSSLTLFAERNTDRQIGGFVMPAGQVQIFNPIFIVLLVPFVAIFWGWLERRGLNPSVPSKFGIGLALTGAGFLVLVAGAGTAGPDFRVALWWLALSYLLQSLGELCVSPVGLSMISRLAMARVAGLMMGVWYLASSMAQFIGGIIVQFASTETVAGEATNPSVSLQTYASVFTVVGIAAIAVGVLCLLAGPVLRRWMQEPG